jgi:hypothetical protein
LVRPFPDLEPAHEISAPGQVFSLACDGQRWVAACFRKDAVGLLLGNGVKEEAFLPTASPDLELTAAWAGPSEDPWIVTGASTSRSGVPAVMLWKGEALSKMLLQGEEEPVSSVAADPSGRFVAAGEIGGRVWLWDRHRRSHLVDRAHPRIAARCIAASSTNRSALATQDGRIIIIRGGLVYFAHLTQSAQMPRGVISATRGNHGQSVGFTTRRYGIPATIVVPHANSVEKNATMRALGVEVIEHGDDFQSAREFAETLARERSLLMVPSFHPLLVAGVATYSLELLKAVKDIDIAYVPIGLGSGICGMLAARNALRIKTEVVGVVSAHTSAYAMSFSAKRPIESPANTQLADGMACRIPEPAAAVSFRTGTTARSAMGLTSETRSAVCTWSRIARETSISSIWAAFLITTASLATCWAARAGRAPPWWNTKGTSYIPPVKQFFYAHIFRWLQKSLIFGNTSALVLCTLLRRILLPENEPAADPYGYPASPCAQRQGVPIIPYPTLGLGNRPGIVSPEVLSLHVHARALSPKTVSHFSGLDMSGVEELLSLHQRPAP